MSLLFAAASLRDEPCLSPVQPSKRIGFVVLNFLGSEDSGSPAAASLCTAAFDSLGECGAMWVGAGSSNLSVSLLSKEYP